MLGFCCCVVRNSDYCFWSQDLILLDRIDCVVSDLFCSIVIRFRLWYICCRLDLFLLFCSHVLVYCWLSICCVVRLVTFC